jgi:hypothetical protein
MTGILPHDWSNENLARLHSLPPADLHEPSDPLIVSIKERGQRVAFEAQRVELAKMLNDILHDEILFETERAFGTDNTRTSYKSDFSKFRSWTAEEGLPCLPTSPEVVAHFIIEAAADGLRIKALERTVSAIRFIHELKDAPFRSDDVLIRAALRWARRKQNAEAERATEIAASAAKTAEPAKANGAKPH